MWGTRESYELRVTSHELREKGSSPRMWATRHLSLVTAFLCFNPRPRMGGDGRSRRTKYQIFVSIHAPVWGATHHPLLLFGKHNVSIHAPVWGATTIVYAVNVKHSFQSTPPYGGRQVITGSQMRHILFQSTPPYGGRHY